MWLLELFGLCLQRPWRWWRWASLLDDICHALFDERSGDGYVWQYRLCQASWGAWFKHEGWIP